MLQARTNRAVRQLLLRQLMTGVAIAAAQLAGRIGLNETDVATSPDGRQLFAFLPVTDQLAFYWVTDGCLVGFFQLLADLARRVVTVQATGLHRLILLQPAHPVLRIVGTERVAEHLLGFLGVFSTRRINRFLRNGRRGDSYGQPEKKGKFEIHGHPLFQRLMPGVSMTVPVAFFCR